MNHKLIDFAVLCVIFLALGFSLERSAYAYVDPGSSLILFQSVGAMITGGLFYFRRRFRSLLSRSKMQEPSAGKNS